VITEVERSERGRNHLVNEIAGPYGEVRQVEGLAMTAAVADLGAGATAE